MPAIVGAVSVGSNRQRRGPIRASNAGVQLYPYVICLCLVTLEEHVLRRARFEHLHRPVRVEGVIFIYFSYCDSLGESGLRV
jgi:hypothetical protein